MKKCIYNIKFAILFSILNITNAYAITFNPTKVYSTDYDEDLAISRPHRTVEIGFGYVQVSYDFSYSINRKLDNGEYDIYVNGFIPQKSYNVSDYLPPYFEHTDLIQIPAGHTAEIRIIEAEYDKYSRQSLYNNSLKSPENSRISQGLVQLSKDYATHRVTYPTDPPARINLISNYRGINIAEITVAPIPYIPLNNPGYSQEQFKVYSKITYRVTFVESNNDNVRNKVKKSSYADDLLFVNNFVINKDETWPQPMSVTSTRCSEEDLLIVTCSSNSDSVHDYALWKESMGLKVHTMVRDDWNTNMLRDSIISYYMNANNPRFVLLIGDENQVPPQKLKTYASSSYIPKIKVNDNFLNCIPEQEAIESDNLWTSIPDICCGRIPFSSPDDVSKVLSMIKNYEIDPPTDAEFYDEVSLAALFEADYSNISPLSKASEYWNFIRLSELEANFLSKNNKNINRIYRKYSEETPELSHLVSPSYYSLTYPFNPGKLKEALPSILLNNNFNWNNDTTSFLKNMDHFLLVYNGHGHIVGLGRPDHSLFEAPCNFLNGRKRPLVLSLGCLTGAYQSEHPTSVCQYLLNNDKGGAIAVIAPTYSLDLWAANHLGACTLEGIFPKINVEFPYGRYDFKSDVSLNRIHNKRLGDIMNYGMANLKYSTSPYHYKEVFSMCNLFGDPSMFFHTEMPSPYKKAEVYRYPSKIKVVGGEAGVISLFNPSSGEKYTSFGTEFIKDVFSKPDDFKIVIANQNKIPFIVNSGTNDIITFQNTIIQGNRCEQIKARKIYIGSNVDSEKDYGQVIIDGTFNATAETIIIEPNTTFTINSDINLEF